MKSCSILVAARADRKDEPVTCGVPWPSGALGDAACLVMRDDRGRIVNLQARALDRWPDGSVRWALLDWLADSEREVSYRVDVEGRAASSPGSALAGHRGDCIHVDTGVARFEVRAGGMFPFAAHGGVAEGVRTELLVEDGRGQGYRPRVERLSLEEVGPVRASIRAEGSLVAEGIEPLAEFDLVLHVFAGSATVRFELTIRNPRRARHPGNHWDLGDEGSVYLRDVSFRIALADVDGPARVRCSPELAAPVMECASPFELYQDSSGGPNWSSPNHVNRSRVVPNSFRGYRLLRADVESAGLRATPTVVLEAGDRAIGVAMEHFWQNFPKSVAANGDSITLGLFPRQYADVHELQGGEQKTHVFHVAFGRDRSGDVPLEWCRQPARPHANPSWYCESRAIPYLTPRDDDPHAHYLGLVDAAVEGGDTFERKREVVDEYGWRHFGDIYGDHEAVFHAGPVPLVSHYNNQYDAIAGFACQYLRSGDDRWRAAMDELARHVVDIDLYHTSLDKSAYNNGQFWHTVHYRDADTSTHRSYPRAAGVGGGGPSGGQLYATGLLLHHLLTGDSRSREAVAAMARWVVDADDGRQTVFRWMDRGPTGHPTASGMASYHGPGRAPANSVRALLDGRRLTGDTAWLEKAEELIRRCIHPADDVAARDLLDAENKWFYTMFLQTLGRYLDDKAELGQLDRMYAYARASLLHYARWMAEHEYPYLAKPEILEYPTETWAAQDMRKSDVFAFAARHASGEERNRFLERSAFFFRSSTATLAEMPTRTLARPVVLLLSNGLMQAFLKHHPETSAPPPADTVPDFGQPQHFVPQKSRAMRRARAVAITMLFAVLAAGLALISR